MKMPVTHSSPISISLAFQMKTTSHKGLLVTAWIESPHYMLDFVTIFMILHSEKTNKIITKQTYNALKLKNCLVLHIPAPHHWPYILQMGSVSAFKKKKGQKLISLELSCKNNQSRYLTHYVSLNLWQPFSLYLWKGN